MSVAKEQEIVLGDGFYWNVCSCCGTIMLPGLSCRVRLVSSRHVRSLRPQAKMSKMMGGEPQRRTTRDMQMVSVPGCGR